MSINMEFKSEFAKKLLEEGKWLEGIDVVKNELSSFCLSKSRKYSNASDLPALTANEDSSVRKFASDLKRKFKEEKRPRNVDRFVEKNSSWLNGPFLEEYLQNIGIQKVSAGPGRPTTPFSELSERTKRQKTSEIREAFSPEKIKHAAKTAMYTKGERTSAALLDELMSSPSKPQKIKNKLKSPEPIPYTDDEALGYLLDMNMTVPHYQQTRNGAVKRKADIYPPYKNVLAAKRRCYPKNIVVNEFSAEVPLQDLLNHTGERLLEVQKEVLKEMPGGPKELVLVSKWGFDSSTGQQIYNQVTTESMDGVAENSLFVVCVVPIKMYVKGNPNFIVWKNPTPSSTRYCRQLSFEYRKETSEFSRTKKEQVQTEIDNLEPTNCLHSSGRVEISHVLAFTMVDGKVVSAVTDTASASTCPTCKATPKMMNNVDLVRQRPVDKESLLLGLSTMHLYIRAFEMIVHISIRLDLENPTWQVRGEENKTVAKKKKYQLQKDFKQKWGLTIEQPSDSGQGNSNCGNTGRTFFGDPTKAATLTGVDEELIERLGVLLCVVNSGYEIDIEKFDDYAIETAQLYVKLYPWFYMPQSVHRLLIHGKQVLEELINLCLTIGEASEEAQETRNKEHKYSREHHTRKISRTKTNEDQMNYMMVTSDPVISDLRTPQTKRKDSFPRKALELLKAGLPTSIESEEMSEDEDSDGDVDIEIQEEEDNGDLAGAGDQITYEDMDIDLPAYYFAE